MATRHISVYLLLVAICIGIGSSTHHGHGMKMKHRNQAKLKSGHKHSHGHSHGHVVKEEGPWWVSFIASADEEMKASEIERMVSAATPAKGIPKIDLKNKRKLPENVKVIMKIVDKEKFDKIFPIANKGKGPEHKKATYSYVNFLKAAAKFPKFCNDKDETNDQCKRELAAVFAMFVQETGAHDKTQDVNEWQQGLWYTREIGCGEKDQPDNNVNNDCSYRGGSCNADTWQGKAWPCPEGVKYYGRGAKQLSYNYNYGPFSEAIFGDANVLLTNPDKVITDGWLAMASGIWFYMTPQSPKPSMHDVITGNWKPNGKDIDAGIHEGFGALINIINGGLECGRDTDGAKNRIEYYKKFCDVVDVTPGENLGCADQSAFVAGGAGTVPNYWEQDWNGGKSCQLVSYMTQFSLYARNSYQNCVEHHFKVKKATEPPLKIALAAALRRASEAAPAAVPSLAPIAPPDGAADITPLARKIRIYSDEDDYGLKEFLEDPETDVEVVHPPKDGCAPPDSKSEKIDLIVIARNTKSNVFSVAKHEWAQLDVPLLVLNPFLWRADRLGYFNTSAMTEPKKVENVDLYDDADQPWVKGLSTSIFRSVNSTTKLVGYDDLFNKTKIVDGGRVIATFNKKQVGIFELSPASDVDGVLTTNRIVGFAMPVYTNFEGQMTENGKSVLRRIVQDLLPAVTASASAVLTTTDLAHKASVDIGVCSAWESLTATVDTDWCALNCLSNPCFSPSCSCLDNKGDAESEDDDTAAPVTATAIQSGASSAICGRWKTLSEIITPEWCAVNCVTNPCLANNCVCEEEVAPKNSTSLAKKSTSSSSRHSSSHHHSSHSSHHSSKHSSKKASVTPAASPSSSSAPVMLGKSHHHSKHSSHHSKHSSHHSTSTKASSLIELEAEKKSKDLFSTKSIMQQMSDLSSIAMEDVAESVTKLPDAIADWHVEVFNPTYNPRETFQNKHKKHHKH